MHGLRIESCSVDEPRLLAGRLLPPVRESQTAAERIASLEAALEAAHPDINRCGAGGGDAAAATASAELRRDYEELLEAFQARPRASAAPPARRTHRGQPSTERRSRLMRGALRGSAAPDTRVAARPS